jgi:hypothetical protein
MVDKISDYLFDRITMFKARNWNKELFTEMLYWYAFKGLLFAVKNDKNDIVGACVVRIVDSKDEYARDEHYNHNPEGDSYFVEFMASDDKLAKHRMVDMVIERLGDKKYVIYERFKHGNRLSKLLTNKFKKLHQNLI